MASSLKFALTALIAAGSLTVANQAEAGNRGLGIGIGIGLGVIALGAIAAGASQKNSHRQRSHSKGSSRNKDREQAQSAARANAQAQARAQAAANARQHAKAEAAARARQQAQAEAASRARARAVAEAKAEAAREARVAAARREKKANDRNEVKVEQAVVRKPADETPAVENSISKEQEASTTGNKSTYVAPPSTAALLNRVDSQQAETAATGTGSGDGAPVVTGSVSPATEDSAAIVTDGSITTTASAVPTSDIEADTAPVAIKPSQGGDCKKFIPSIGVTVSVGC